MRKRLLRTAFRPLCDALPTVLITPALRPPTRQPACDSASPTPAAALILSMVFISTVRHPLGILPPTTKDHAYPIRYPTRHRGSILAKLGFPPMTLQTPKSQHTPKPKTMLSRCAANDLPAWQPAAFVLSMVFSLWARQLLGIWGGGFKRPCLANMQPESTASSTFQYSTRSKHGVCLWHFINPGEDNRQTQKPCLSSVLHVGITHPPQPLGQQIR